MLLLTAAAVVSLSRPTVVGEHRPLTGREDGQDGVGVWHTRGVCDLELCPGVIGPPCPCPCACPCPPRGVVRGVVRGVLMRGEFMRDRARAEVGAGSVGGRGFNTIATSEELLV